MQLGSTLGPGRFRARTLPLAPELLQPVEKALPAVFDPVEFHGDFLQKPAVIPGHQSCALASVGVRTPTHRRDALCRAASRNGSLLRCAARCSGIFPKRAGEILRVSAQAFTRAEDDLGLLSSSVPAFGCRATLRWGLGRRSSSYPMSRSQTSQVATRTSRAGRNLPDLR